MKLGRKARRYDPRVPHLSRLLAGQTLPPVPAPLNWTAGMPSNFGMMLNNVIGDCTCAGWGHQKQIWTFNAAGAEVTTPDTDIEALYAACGGYVPGDPNTDNGCIEQDVLNYLHSTGLDGDKLDAYFEVDVRNHDDVKRTVAWCGGSYIGFQVPAYLMQLTVAGSTWDVPGASGVPSDADTSDVGGHCVVVCGFDDAGLDLISWGAQYRMSWAFWAAHVDEAYGLIDADWLRATGQTPANMTLAELQAQMQAIAQAPAPADAAKYHTKDKLHWFVNLSVEKTEGQPASVNAGVSVSL
jgi:hypothetical protein